jgi:hypothetical protein
MQIGVTYGVSQFVIACGIPKKFQFGKKEKPPTLAG